MSQPSSFDACVRGFVNPKVMAVINFANALLIGLVGVFYFIVMPTVCPPPTVCLSDVLCGFYCVRGRPVYPTVVLTLRLT
jgi:hypothetical protein